MAKIIFEKGDRFSYVDKGSSVVGFGIVINNEGDAVLFKKLVREGDRVTLVKRKVPSKAMNIMCLDREILFAMDAIMVALG